MDPGNIQGDHKWHLAHTQAHIGFQRVPGHHDGKHVASAFVNITDSVKITDKVRYYCTAVHLLLTQYRLGGSHLTTQPTMTPSFSTWADP